MKTNYDNGYRPLVSLCIPTNGVIEWVIPVLNSIYDQNVDEDLFEVIVEDNGNSNEFYRRIVDYSAMHKNLIYKKTDAQRFLCQIESFKTAKGLFVKFVNHRSKLNDGVVEYLIKFVRENYNIDSSNIVGSDIHDRNLPVVFFSNGSLKGARDSRTINSFNNFVKELSYWSSWSGGLGFWKDDFDKLSINLQYNNLFPHITILFSRRDASKYIVDNRLIFSDIDTGHESKGKYNLFFAFAVEFPSLLNDLVRAQVIDVECFCSVKANLYDFICDLYYQFIVIKKPCSYDLTDYKKYISIFYSISEVKRRCVKLFFRNMIKKYMYNRKCI